MTAARSQILAAIVARLAGVSGMSADRVELMPSGDPDAFPALGVHDHGQRNVDGEAGSTTYELQVTVDGFVEGDGAREAIGELYVGVVAALVTEPPLDELAGGVSLIDEGDTRVDVAELASTGRIAFATDFAIQFATPRGDPSRFA
ncbi:hypothetical protein [Sphingomonas profundi]|uniref:hypothetical protein n=1 Tax=Alterirhizorhabdus profundi TaxID=2681549 RepID=UPI0012E9581C|nr:hypothetical protein [Sphingomonas profundi]